MAGSEKRILVVEDDPSSSEILEEALVSAGYEVDTAANAEEAFAKVKFWKPHLVLSDHDMPGISGLEMLKKLRQNSFYVTLVFVSGRSDSKIIVEALKEGADDFIKKPFRIDELLARVEANLRQNEVHQELLEANEKLQDLVDIDHLTGLYNMRSMYDKIDYELKRAFRYKSQVACIMLDMDHFKTVNDTNDHLFGSYVLQRVGEMILHNIREIDFAARYGGDEYLIVLGDADETAAKVVCERIRKAIEMHEFRDGDNHIKLTVSLGYSLSKPSESLDSRALVRAADHALYEAKRSGRNRVASAS